MRMVDYFPREGAEAEGGGCLIGGWGSWGNAKVLGIASPGGWVFYLVGALVEQTEVGWYEIQLLERSAGPIAKR